MKQTALVLFSGLAADATVFALQATEFPQLIVPDWPVPLRGETMDAYCDRMAVDLRKLGPVIVGGASFGGIVALHMAVRLETRALVLIGSVESPEELPRYARAARVLRPLIPWIPVRLMQICCWPAGTRAVHRWMPHLAALASQFRGSHPHVLKWSLQQILQWRSKPQLGCRLFHIHGDRDRVLPIRYTTATKVVAGGGHVISLTHSRQVNQFLHAVIETVGSAAEGGGDSSST